MSAALHRGPNEAIKADHIDPVDGGGLPRRNLWDALSTGRQGGYAGAANLQMRAVAATPAGDAIMIKGSLGSTPKTIVNAPERRFPGKAARDEAAV